MWQKFKRDFSNKVFKTIQEVEDFICNQVKSTTKETTKSICSYQYIFLITIGHLYKSFWYYYRNRSKGK